MKKHEIEHAVIKNIIKVLAVMCAGDVDKIIDLLSGYLWDEEETAAIKKSSGEYLFKIPTIKKG